MGRESRPTMHGDRMERAPTISRGLIVRMEGSKKESWGSLLLRRLGAATLTATATDLFFFRHLFVKCHRHVHGCFDSSSMAPPNLFRRHRSHRFFFLVSPF